jgi:hypothetical protein
MGKQKRGRPFANGNPGRQSGSKNKSTLLAAALSGEQGEALLAKAIKVAKGGNVVMLKFLLERVLPKERIIPIQLPRIDSALDGVTAMSTIVAAVAAGLITPREAADLTHVVDTYVRSIEITEQEHELQTLRRMVDPKAANLDKVYAEKSANGGHSNEPRLTPED